MSNSVLITGGLGYLGGRIAIHLVQNDFSVRVSTRHVPEDLPAWCGDVEVVRAHLEDDESLEAACQGVEAIVHLAAMNEIFCGQDPVGALLVNAVGTTRVLEAAKRMRVSRLIYMSTAHVYGSPLVGEITETSLPRPGHSYATSHKAAEDVVLAASDRGEVEGVILRLSNGFGAPADRHVDRWSLLVNDLCRQAVTLGEITLKTSGTQLRDFVTLADVAHAVEIVLGIPSDRRNAGLFNLGGEHVCSIIVMTEFVASRVEQCLGFRPSILRPDPDPDEVSKELFYRIDRLRAHGYVPMGSHEKEIDRTLELCQAAWARPRDSR